MCARILFVDDDPTALLTFERIFRRLMHDTVTAKNAKEALDILKSSPPFHIVVSDYMMPEMSGDILLQEVSRRWPDTRRVILSSYADKDLLLNAINIGGVHRYLTKPWDLQELLTVIEELTTEYDNAERDRNSTKETDNKNHQLATTNNQLEESINLRITALQEYQHQLQKSNDQVRLYERAEALREDEHTLRKTNESLRFFSRELENRWEEEKNALARDIHDELAQSLAVIRLEISSQLRSTVDVKNLDNLKEIKKHVDSTAHSVKRILSALRPQILDEFGFEAAVIWIAGDFQNRSGIRCDLSYDIPTPVSKETSNCLYRIIQEAQTNIIRHSQATAANISLCQRNKRIYLKISDNGIGIQKTGPNETRSFGLIGIQERAMYYGGKCAISSNDDGGTSIEVEIPNS